ncbi:MAG: tRNA pseudouridine(13) synthase TruD, partial [Candidatus Lokiarchaeota archaeon]|nr:tRNA pseudouridine(13) synthase TruD [Candidatus Lokiarchaeota archaeon]
NIDKKIIEKLPNNLFFEKNCLKLMIDSNLDYKKIIYSVFRENLITLFIHAYQSYLFNKILSEKMKSNRGKIKEGDIVIILDYSGLPSNKTIYVRNNNIKLIERLIKNKKAVLGIPIIGEKLINNAEVINQYEIPTIMKGEEINLNSLKFQFNDQIKIKGEFRAAFIYPELFKYKILNVKSNNQKKAVKFSFSLQKGSYATIFLREFLKTNPLNY